MISRVCGIQSKYENIQYLVMTSYWYWDTKKYQISGAGWVKGKMSRTHKNCARKLAHDDDGL